VILVTFGRGEYGFEPTSCGRTRWAPFLVFQKHICLGPPLLADAVCPKLEIRQRIVDSPESEVPPGGRSDQRSAAFFIVFGVNGN
jgi:hypothetical protein